MKAIILLSFCIAVGVGVLTIDSGWAAAYAVLAYVMSMPAAMALAMLAFLGIFYVETVRAYLRRAK